MTLRSYSYNPSSVAITGGTIQSVGLSLAKVGPIEAWGNPKTAVLRETVRMGLGNALICIDGDSIVHGWANGASGLRARSIPAIVAQILNAAGVPAENDSVFGYGGEASSAALLTYDPRVTIGSGWGIGTPYTVGGLEFVNNSVTNTSITFLPTNIWDRAEVWVVGASQTCNFSIDNGGVASNYTSTINTFTRHTFVATARAAQTLTIKRTSSATEPLSIVGFHTYDSQTPRVAVFNYGTAAATSTDKLSAFSSYTPIAQNAMGGVPVLSVLSLGINDRRNGIASATYQSNMQSHIATRKAVGEMLAFIPPPSKISDTPQATQDLYDNIFRALCVSNGIPCFDTPVAWNYWLGANASGLFGSDNIHPAVAGEASIAYEIAARILASQ